MKQDKEEYDDKDEQEKTRGIWWQRWTRQDKEEYDDKDEQDNTRRDIMILECDNKTACEWPVIPCPNLPINPPD